MIITHIVGGLGNQLFQYAVGRALANRLKLPLKLDVTAFETYKSHSYYLHNYPIIGEIATKDEIEKLKYLPEGFFQKLGRRFSKKERLYSPFYFSEPHYHFSSQISQLSSKIYLEGYWQSEKYFSEIAEILRRELVPKSQSSQKTILFLEEINSCESVSIHIRRGDYLTNQNAFNTHGICSLDFYRKSADLLYNQLSNPHFFIFSDDPLWVKENFHLDYPMTLVTHNASDTNYDDLYLMSRCRHNIIANSTFSWWGAWLNSYSKKLVFVPKPWFKDSKLNSKDLIPASWHQLISRC